MRYIIFFLFISLTSLSQDRNGMTYQALILNPDLEQLPGADNSNVPLANTDICIRFHITTNSGSFYEYSEEQSLTTDKFGMINTVIGRGAPLEGNNWDDINWSSDPKGLTVEIDYSSLCSNFVVLSEQELTSVPFALYSPASDIPGPQGPQGETGPQGPQGCLLYTSPSPRD